MEIASVPISPKNMRVRNFSNVFLVSVFLLINRDIICHDGETWHLPLITDVYLRRLRMLQNYVAELLNMGEHCQQQQKTHQNKTHG